MKVEIEMTEEQYEEFKKFAKGIATYREKAAESDVEGQSDWVTEHACGYAQGLMETHPGTTAILGDWYNNNCR